MTTTYKRIGINPVMKFYNTDGSVLASGTVETYTTNTSTPVNSYSSYTGSGAATSFTLDANGEAVRFFDADTSYKLIVKTSGGATVRTIDPFTAVPAPHRLDANLDVTGYSIISTNNANIRILPNGSGKIVLDNHSWPNVDGTNGQVITTNGSGVLSWTSTSSNLVSDVAPQLGGNLDCNGYNIGFDTNTGIRDDSNNEQLYFTKTASAVNYLNITNAATGNAPVISALGSDSNIGITLTPKGSGVVKISGLSYPTADGSLNQCLITNGSGVLSFSDLRASQSEMEAATSTTVYVSPGRLQFHPGVAKGWVSITPAAAINASHNVSSITDNGAGDYTINWTTSFSSANYACVGTYDGTNDSYVSFDTAAAGSIKVNVIDGTAGTLSESGMSYVYIAAFGDQ